MDPEKSRCSEKIKKLQGGVSIDFRDIRFKEEIPRAPGPIYDISETLFKRKIRSHPGTWRGPPGKVISI